MESCDVREATHVKAHGNKPEKIKEKWGIRENGTLAPPSEGGFGVVTESGKRLSMYDAEAYYKVMEN